MRKVPPEIARKLVEAADQLGANFDDLRMEDIAQASSIPRATLYYHFAGKDDVLAFLHDAMLVAFQEHVRAPSDGAARERLVGLIARQLAHIASHPAVTQLLVLNLGRLGKFADLATSPDHPIVEPFRRILSEGISKGEVRPIDVDTTAVALSDAVHTLGLRTAVAGELDDPVALAEHFVDLFWNGAGTPM
jgi:AcrR family transcriptional regulator